MGPRRDGRGARTRSAGLRRAHRGSANATYVGAITEPEPLAALDPRDAALLAAPDDPWMLLSLSTTLKGQEAAFPAMLEAVGALPVRVLLTLGGAIPASTVAAPANVTVREFVPHDLVLQHMSVVLSHGGLSTITASLGAGVPLVRIPQGRDQLDNSARVEVSGVGRALAMDASAADIAAALVDVLDDRAVRCEAQRFAGVIAELGGGELATQKTVALATRH